MIKLTGEHLYELDDIMKLADVPAARRLDQLADLRDLASRREIVQHSADMFGVSKTTMIRLRRY